MKADRKRQRELLSFGIDYTFPVESKRQLILTRMCKYIHRSGTYTAASLKEPFEALLDLSLPCHPLSSHITFLPFPILAPAVMGIEGRGRVREKVQLHLDVSFASLKVLSSSFLDTLWFHLRSFSGPPLPLEVGTEIHLREMEKGSTGSFILLLLVCWVVLFLVSVRIIKGLSPPKQPAFLGNIICSNKTEDDSPNQVSFESITHHSCSNSSAVIYLHSAEFQ